MLGTMFTLDRYLEEISESCLLVLEENLVCIAKVPRRRAATNKTAGIRRFSGGDTSLSNAAEKMVLTWCEFGYFNRRSEYEIGTTPVPPVGMLRY